MGARAHRGVAGDILVGPKPQQPIACANLAAYLDTVRRTKPPQYTIRSQIFRNAQERQKAYSFFESLNKADKFAIAWRLATAKKPETRERRMSVLFEMLSQGKKLH
ncbi:MAG TPA: YdeI/OmpD-associated family protein [Blastocatellia bacterium]|nr:YdeI/OmpD-associated family protein [Blastocatellia bacterium]